MVTKNEWELTTAEIRTAMSEAMDEAQDYGDDGKPLPEIRVAKAQAKKLVEYLLMQHTIRWQALKEEVGL